MLVLKNADYRHDAEGNRIAEVTLHTDDLSSLPTASSDIPGMKGDEILGEGSVALDVTSGAVSMFDGTQWNNW